MNLAKITNYVTMRKATQEEIDKFVNYRANHIALVRRLGRVLFDLDLTEHDKDKIECNADDLNLYALRNAMQDGDYRPLKNDKVILNNLAGRHVKSQKHHPEYWDDAITVDSFNYEEPPVVNASKMPDRYLVELVCDWSAVAIKLNKGIFQWFNKTCTGSNPRFKFTPRQKCIIIDSLLKVQKNIKKEKLYYPGKDYDAKKDYPEVEEDVLEYRKKHS